MKHHRENNGILTSGVKKSTYTIIFKMKNLITVN